MKKLLFFLLILSSCTKEHDERMFTVKVYPDQNSAYTIYFPLMEVSETNPMEIRFMDFLEYYEVEVMTISPLRINAFAKKKDCTIYVEIYENGLLLLKDSAYSRNYFPEIWIDYEW